MRNRTTNDPILHRFREATKQLHSPALDRVPLLASRALGNARENSDHDFAVFRKQTRGKPGQARAGQDQPAKNQPLWSPPKLST
jgi:hypothetical protein